MLWGTQLFTAGFVVLYIFKTSLFPFSLVYLSISRFQKYYHASICFVWRPLQRLHIEAHSVPLKPN
jgi:hypothetical protein